jgi:O-antigen ligase
MVIIYNFLNNVWKDIKQENKNNFAFVFIILLSLSLPFKLAVTNTLLILFGLIVFWNYKKLKFNLPFSLLLPIVLFALMIASFLWTIDVQKTAKAAPKEIFLLIIPLLFAVIPRFNTNQINKISKYYAYGFTVFALFFILRAIIRFFIVKDTAVFFYHQDKNLDLGLIPKELNAIHFSVFTTLAYVHFLANETKNIWQKITMTFLLVFVLLLSSKNIILMAILITVIYIFYFAKSANRMRLRNLIVFTLIVSSVVFFGRIKNRFIEEFQANTNKSMSHNVITGIPDGTHNISIYEVWNNESFTANDYFPGTAFRVYQTRLFLEFLSEEPIFWKGFGLNASFKKLEEKGEKYKVYKGTGKDDGYQNKNFHNQYIQNFAELGVFGFLILIIMLFILLKKALHNKDFIHFTFSILMISVFLTESFMWRQRGVVFFVLFYCLFMTDNLKKEKLNQQL